MKLLVSSPLKQVSIGQCLLKAARERFVLPPLMFGLAVEIDNIFGSKWLINELCKLGFSISYDEVTKYKQTVLSTTDVEDILSTAYTGCFTQWVADNVDHNVRTLDGKNTFHGMGMIAVSTKLDESEPIQERRLQIPKKKLKVQDLITGKGVPINWYDFPKKKGLQDIVFTSLQRNLSIMPSSTNIDLLWQSAALFNTADRKRPNWSGFMQYVSQGEHPPQSKITLLPIIDLNPSDYSCIYSVLVYIEGQARKLHISTACTTFDQPLYFKAMEIITAKKMNIVCRLGGFHTLMSFLVSIGYLMAGSGLEEALHQVYGENSVVHMMSGKAVARALRGHMLVVDSALNMILMEEMFPQTKVDDQGRDDAEDMLHS